MTERRSRRSAVAFFALFLASGAVSACGAARKEAAQPATPAESKDADERTHEDQLSGAPASAPESEEAAPARGGYAPPPAAAPMPGSARSMDAEKSAGGEPDGELAALSGRLESALTLAAPNCSMAWSLRDRICDLSQRLCDMASRSAEPELAERCSDGRSRCERATARVRAACAE